MLNKKKFQCLLLMTIGKSSYTVVFNICATNMQFRPVVGWVNHQYVPLQFRVIVQGVFACFWYNALLLIENIFAPHVPDMICFIQIFKKKKIWFSCMFCRGIFLNLRAKSLAPAKPWEGEEEMCLVWFWTLSACFMHIYVYFHHPKLLAVLSH